MTQMDCEYRGLVAATWDTLRGDTSRWADRFFYREIIEQSGQPVLDVGCGTGRLLLDYLAEGIDSDGVDNSLEMLALCRAKAAQRGMQPRLYEQAMEALALPRRYRTIIVPSSSFQLLTDIDDARAAMARFCGHLEPGGVLVIPFMVLYQGEPTSQPVVEDWHLLAEKTRAEDGAVVRPWTRSTLDVSKQLEHTEDRFEITLDGVVIAQESHLRSPATRWYTQEQAVALYGVAGFSGIRVLSKFSFAPAAAGDSLFTVSAMRPLPCGTP